MQEGAKSPPCPTANCQNSLPSSTPSSAPISELLVIEIFSGTCNLSAAFVQCGFQALAIDHVSSSKFRTFLLDLTLECDQRVLLELISIHRPFLVWLAPPCGTASLAKNIPAFDAKGLPLSQPLRSTEYPDGLPDLTGIDLDRVLAANTLYELCERVCALCDLLDL